MGYRANLTTQKYYIPSVEAKPVLIGQFQKDHTSSSSVYLPNTITGTWSQQIRHRISMIVEHVIISSPLSSRLFCPIPSLLAVWTYISLDSRTLFLSKDGVPSMDPKWWLEDRQESLMTTRVCSHITRLQLSSSHAATLARPITTCLLKLVLFSLKQGQWFQLPIKSWYHMLGHVFMSRTKFSTALSHSKVEFKESSDASSTAVQKCNR